MQTQLKFIFSYFSVKPHFQKKKYTTPRLPYIKAKGGNLFVSASYANSETQAPKHFNIHEPRYINRLLVQ